MGGWPRGWIPLFQKENMDNIIKSPVEVLHEFIDEAIRRRKETRKILPRRQGRLKSRELDEPVQSKIYSLNGQEFERPEMESLRRAARKTGRAALEIKTMLFKPEKPEKL